MSFRISRDIDKFKYQVSVYIIMKGISMAIETIVAIIIAVVVLSLLLAWLQTGTGPGRDITKYLQDKSNGCLAYRAHDCKTDFIAPGTLSTACRELAKAGYIQTGGGAPGCISGGSDCIPQCCKDICPAGA